MTTPNLAPCPFCGGTDIASTEDDDELIAIFCSGCSAGSGYCQTWDEAAALWNARVGLPSRAWEMGRDAAARILKDKWEDYAAQHSIYDPSTGVTEYPGDGDEWVAEWQETEDEVRALTPPATLAGIEISDEMVERASIAAWDAWNDVNDHRALGWPAWQSLHPVQAMEWRESIRAALTAALTYGESNG